MTFFIASRAINKALRTHIAVRQLWSSFQRVFRYNCEYTPKIPMRPRLQPTHLLRPRLLGIVLLCLPWTLVCAADVQATGWLGPGIRQDSLDWNIAGNLAGTNPNVISELQWKNLYTAQLQGGVEMLLHQRFYVRGELGYGKTNSGDNQDSDYAYNNRQGEFSRSNSQGGGGYMADASVGIGIPYNFSVGSRGHFRVIPLLGFASNMQHVKIHDGVQTVSDTATARAQGLIRPTESIPPVGYQLTGLDSSYTALWYGFWLGADLDYVYAQKSRFIARVELHNASLYGEGNWNLRTDYEHPRSYEHEINGYGWVMALGWQQLLPANWDIRGMFNLQSWSAKSGVIRFYTTQYGTLAQHLNEVNWQSRSLMVSVGYDFSRK